MFQEAVRWSSGGPAAAISSGGAYANATSADGQVIVGRRGSASGDEAFRWTLATGIVGLGDFSGGAFYSEAHGVSADGFTIVGQSFSASGSEAFCWTSGAGMVPLGDLPGGIFYSYARGVSGDGSLIVGSAKSASGDEAFIWDATNGMRSLKSVLIDDYGVTGLDLWTLTQAKAVSADGSTIVGYGTNPAGQIEAWRVTGIPEPSSAVLLLSGSLFLLRPRTLRTHERSA